MLAYWVSGWTDNFYWEEGAESSVLGLGLDGQFLLRRGAQIRRTTVFGLWEGWMVRQVIFMAMNTKLHACMCREGCHFVFEMFKLGFWQLPTGSE